MTPEILLAGLGAPAILLLGLAGKGARGPGRYYRTLAAVAIAAGLFYLWSES
jgi:hypothetical protein